MNFDISDVVLVKKYRGCGGNVSSLMPLAFSLEQMFP